MGPGQHTTTGAMIFRPRLFSILKGLRFTKSSYLLRADALQPRRSCVRTFLLASVTTFLVASCGSNSSQPTYDAAIQEGQTAAQELVNQGASAVAIALVDDKRIIWSQRFGLPDRTLGSSHESRQDVLPSCRLLRHASLLLKL